MDARDGLDVRGELADATLCAFDAREEVIAIERLWSWRLHAGVCAVDTAIVHWHVGVRNILLLRVGLAQRTGLRILRRLRVVGLAMALERRGRVELLLRLVILLGRVSLVNSGRAGATAYSSAIGVG